MTEPLALRFLGCQNPARWTGLGKHPGLCPCFSSHFNRNTLLQDACNMLRRDACYKLSDITNPNVHPFDFIYTSPQKKKPHGANILLLRNPMWNWHEVVVKDGRVYDALTGPKGMTITEYKNLWGVNQDVILWGF